MFTTDDGNIPPVSASLPVSIGNIVFDQHGIEKELNRLNVNKPWGPDGIPPRILHDMSSEVAPILTFIFQQSYDSGIVPKDWSMAMVSQIFKTGDKSQPCNYRPVSLTCICCKVMEHVVLCHLNRFLSANNILTDLQHGFNPTHSHSPRLGICD